MRAEVRMFIDELCGENWDADAFDHRRGIFGPSMDSMSDEDWNGVFGIACMYAYLSGVKPTLGELSDYLDVSVNDIKYPFQKLLQSGVFSKAYNARSDTWLNLLNSKKTHDIDKIRCAWGYIAGISADSIIRNYSNMDIKALD